MTFRLPDDCAAVTLEGRPLVIGRDRTIDADATQASALAAHGIVPVEAPEPEAAPATPRGRARQARA